MAKTIPEAFDILIERLKPSESETASAATHRGSIESRLTTDFGMQRIFRSGSFGHGTSVKGYSDLDYFAVIPAANLWASSTYTLQKVKDSMQARFPATSVTVRTPAVVVPFGGGGAGERHEIIPSYADGSKNGYSLYAIPDRANGWMHSAPGAHAAWVNAINEKHAKKVKQLIRLVKYWNYIHSVGIRSFYVEMRTAEYASSETSILYNHDVKRALNHMLSKSLAAMQDPQGLVGYFHPCSDAVKVGALSKLETAVTRAQKAIDAESAGKTADAFYWWNLMFDGNFPAYY